MRLSWFLLWARGNMGVPSTNPLTLEFGDGRRLEIISKGPGGYAPSVELNGHSYATAWLPLGQLSAGLNRLEFTLGTGANQAWASRPDQLPPSFDIPEN